MLEQDLKDILKQVENPDNKAQEAAKKRWNQVAKPLYSLGLLEETLVTIAGICRTPRVRIEKKALVIMCADNGVVEEGVTQAGQEVTAIVTQNFTKGDSCACIMAKQAGVNVFPVDIGVASPLDDLGERYPLLQKKIAYGTKNIHREPAMTRAETLSAIETGIHLVEDLKNMGYGLIATGEMGIGNTTTSSAVASVLLGQDPDRMTGRGAGLTKQGVQNKIRVIREAIALHKPDRLDGIDVLSKVGGLDLAGLTGIFLGGAIYQVPILLDGFISGTAALAAFVICPRAREYMLATHQSSEPAGAAILNALGLKPMIHAEMCLGEGTGAIAAVPLLSMAVAVYDTMSTFHDIEIEDYQPLDE